MVDSGYVLDESNAPIAGAEVTVVDANNKKYKDANKKTISVKTNAAGMYSIDAPENYKLRAEKSGYQSAVFDFGYNAKLKKTDKLANVNAVANIFAKVNQVFEGTTVSKTYVPPSSGSKTAPDMGDKTKPNKPPMTLGSKIAIGVAVLAVASIVIGVIYSSKSK